MVLTVLLNERVLTNILELVLNDIEIMKYCYLTTSPLLNTSYTTYITQSVDVLEKAVLFYISPNSVIDPSSPSPDDQPQRSLSPDQEPASALDTPTSEPLLVPIKRNHTKKKKVIQSTPAPKESESAISSQPRPSHSPTPSINTIKLPSADTLGLPIPDWSAQDKSVSADDVKTIDLTVLPLRRSPPIELVYDRAPLDLPSLLPQKLASHKDSPDAAVLTSLVVHSEQVGAIEPFPSQPSTEPRSTSAAARDTPRSQSASAEELTAARGSGDGGKEDETLFDAVDCSLFYSTLPRGNMFIVAPSTFTTVPFANTTIILPQATPLAE
ncbi:hypothetical protein BLNAU_8762 [Blattamonas nauphoetae]|uniref:RUN domain-containing protein n=1 Tax=Blattamonas nauphoetae TaxID=2049346 RepID=A0ABQ9XXJ9_9EUKA|nr:hypothetical protein BLNAU_8762 [Blattamonas nauphoetae]